MSKESFISTLEGIKYSLEAIQAAGEIRSQTGPVRSRLTATDLDTIMFNSIVALKRLNNKLEEELKADNE